MTMYPDGEALSEWEWQILEDLEWEMEMSDSQMSGALLSQDGPTPPPVLAAWLVAAEAVVALAAVTVSLAGAMAELATLGARMWVAAVPTARALRTTPGRAGRGREVERGTEGAGVWRRRRPPESPLT
jgi:hypothetical protein